MLFLLCLGLVSQGMSAAQSAADMYDTEGLVSLITGVREPQSMGDFVIFTAPADSRHVGISFDFENFRTIHSMQRLDTTAADGKSVDSLYFYILSVPRQLTSVSYRLVIDGLWTTDPQNPDIVYDRQIGAELSVVRINRPIERKTEQIAGGLVSFVYEGEPNQQIRLAGSFTNWDSYIYRMKETRPGFYELTLPLLQGTYYYLFYNGTASFPDVSNSERVYTSDGRSASVIRVQ